MRYERVLILLTLLFTFIASVADAQEWKELRDSNGRRITSEDAYYSYRIKDVRVLPNGLTQMWMRVSPLPSVDIETFRYHRRFLGAAMANSSHWSSDEWKHVAYFLEKDEFDCAGRRYRTRITTAAYAAEGSLLGTLDNELAVWSIAVPNSVSEATVDAVCSLNNHRVSQKESRRERKAVTGTGFFVTSRHVVTNYHVIGERSEIAVRIDSLDFSATVLICDESNDLALLMIEDSSTGFKRSAIWNVMSAADQTLGEKVFTFGYPFGDVLGTSAKYSEGVISSMTGLLDDPRMMQVSLPVQPGNSGGPLFNERGELVGIVVASLDAGYIYKHFGSIPQNVNFAIKSDYLSNLLRMLPDYETEKQSGAWPMDNQGLMSTVVQVIAR